jgi:preprotein translocase subunit YajC
VGYLIIIVVLFILMWAFLIRPQRRRQTQQEQMQETLEVGAEILTAGGIHGTVREIEGDVVQVEIAPNTVIRLDRRAVAGVAEEPEPEEDLEEEPLLETKENRELEPGPEAAASRDES